MHEAFPCLFQVLTLLIVLKVRRHAGDDRMWDLQHVAESGWGIKETNYSLTEKRTMHRERLGKQLNPSRRHWRIKPAVRCSFCGSSHFGPRRAIVSVCQRSLHWHDMLQREFCDLLISWVKKCNWRESEQSNGSLEVTSLMYILMETAEWRI